MKKVLAITLTLLSIKSFALTEDYILWSRTEIYAQKKQVKKNKQSKKDICQKLSKNEATEKTCIDSKKSLKTIKNCLENTKTALNQEFCLVSKNITKSNVVNCYNSTTDGNSEIACLALVEKGSVKTDQKIVACAGLGPAAEITCLKFQ